MLETAAEPVIWSGRPRGGFRFQRGDWFMVPFSLLWGGGVFAAFIGTLFTFTSPSPSPSSNAPPPLVLGAFVFVFFLVAVYITVGRFLVDMYLRSITTYELRGDSAIIRRGGPFANTTEVYLPSVSSMNVDVSGDGSGTIYFGPRPSFLGGTGMGSYGPNSPAFVKIDRAQEVFDRCKALQRRTA